MSPGGSEFSSMRLHHREATAAGNPNRRGGGGRFIVMVPAGCLTALLLAFLLSWISLRFLPKADTTSVSRNLSWEADLAAHGPASSEVDSISTAGLVGVFTAPGVLSVEDAVEGDGEWVLLDRRQGKLHFLDTESGRVRSVGREGQGPGELRDPVALAMSDSHLWVLNQRGMMLDRFSREGDFQARSRIQGGACLVGLAQDLLASPGDSLLLLRVCPPSLPGPGSAWIEAVSHEGELTPRVSLALGRFGSRRLTLFRTPAMAAGSRGWFLGSWDAPCVAELSLSTGGARRRCLPAFPRAQTPPSGQEKLRRRFSRLPDLGLLPVEVPDLLPWFDRLFVIPQGLVIRRIRGEDLRDLVLLDSLGAASVLDRLLPENTFMGDHTVLATRDMLEGTQIQIFRNPWR